MKFEELNLKFLILKNQNQSYYDFWVELWCAFVLELLSLSPIFVCLFLKKKKKIKIILNFRTKSIIYRFSFLRGKEKRYLLECDKHVVPKRKRNVLGLGMYGPVFNFNHKAMFKARPIINFVNWSSVKWAHLSQL